mmetsp:Transcript_171405/g.416794  ORF Transcript_171405/g.416794 Transcript_171405/m.416794 type:complete len:278 (+) Transcript_171405:33-866(+)
MLSEADRGHCRFRHRRLRLDQAVATLCQALASLPLLAYLLHFPQGPGSTRQVHRLSFVARPGSGSIFHAGRRSAVGQAAKEADQELVYNYFSQQYALKPKAKAVDLLTQLSELLPWTEAEREALAFQDERQPNWRESPMAPADETDVRRRFRAIVAGAGSEAAALNALRRNPAVLLFGAGQLRRAGEVLTDGLGSERAAEVIRKNPGVLTIAPSNLKDSLPAVSAAAEVIDVLVQNGEVARTAFSLVQLGVAVSIGKALFDVVRFRLVDAAGTALPS